MISPADLRIDQDRAGALGLVIESFTGTTFCVGCQRRVTATQGTTTGWHPGRNRRWCRDCTALITSVRPGLVFNLVPERGGDRCTVTKVLKSHWTVVWTPQTNVGGPFTCDLGDFPRRVAEVLAVDRLTQGIIEKSQAQRRKAAQGSVLIRMSSELGDYYADLVTSQDGMPEDPGLDHLLMDLKSLVERLARLGLEREKGQV